MPSKRPAALEREFDPANEIQWLYKATRFTFNLMPPNMCRTARDYPIHIEACEQRDGSVLWAVRQMGNCLRRDGYWELECLLSSRDDAWIAMHRFETKEQSYGAVMRLLKKEGSHV